MSDDQAHATELQRASNDAAPATSNTLPADTATAVKSAEHEPIEGGSVVTVTADAAEGALLTNVTPTIFSALSFVALVLYVIATPLPWLRSDLGARTFVSLWSTEVTTSPSRVVLDVGDYACAEQRQYFRAAEAFAIITIFFALVTLVVGLAARARASSAKPLGTVFALLTLASGVVCWAVAVSAYRRSFCGQATYDDRRFFVYTGASVFVAGWVLTAVALAVSLKDVRLPTLLPQALVDRVIFTAFTLVAFGAFVFAVVSTPIPIVSQWMAQNTVYRASIWHLYIYTNGVMTTKTSLYELGCTELARYARATQAFTVMSIFTCLFAFAAGLLALRGVGGYKTVVLTGIFATATALIATSLDLAIYFKDFCPTLPTFDAMHFHRDAGVALIATSAVTMAAVTLVAIGSVVLQLLRDRPAGGNVSAGSFVYLIGTLVSVIFLIVGVATPVYQREVSNTDWVKVFWWHIQSLSQAPGRTLVLADFTCEAVWQRLVGGASIAVAAIGISAIGAVLGVLQFVKGGLNAAASALGFLSAALQLVAFLLAVDAWRREHCGYSFKAAGFDYDIGFALVPSSFCVTVVVSVLNLVLKA